MLHCSLKGYLPRQEKRSAWANAAALSMMAPLLVCDCRKNSEPSSILALNCRHPKPFPNFLCVFNEESREVQ